MLKIKEHIKFLKKVMEERNIHYFSTQPMRTSTIYWSVNTYSILKKTDLLESSKYNFLSFITKCKNKDGGYGGNIGMPSTVYNTFISLQILYIYKISSYDTLTVNFILSNLKEDGSFRNDKYGEIDVRFACCAVLSLYILSIMKKKEGLFTFDGQSTPYTSDGQSTPYTSDGQSTPYTSEETIGSDEMSTEELSSVSKMDFLNFIKSVKYDYNKTVSYVMGCYNRDGGYGNIIGGESHAAHTFCCISILRSLNCLHLVDRKEVSRFISYRQKDNGGLCGRINKKEDVCYSFWAYSVLVMLETSEYIDKKKLEEFILKCQGNEGGFSDRPGNLKDPYHLMFALAGLSLLEYPGLKSIDPGLAL